MKANADAVSTFLSQFLTPSDKSSTQDNLLSRAQHWISVYERTSAFYPDANQFELRTRRRNARQNLRRILDSHPELIPTLKARRDSEGAK